MSKGASLAIISVTITVTACLAIAMFFMNPNAGEDSYGAKVLAEAKARQTQSIVSVPEPLQTDIVVLTEEEKMAEKVSLILASDEKFVDEIGEKAAPVVGERISDLEVTYSSDMVGRIEASNADVKAYVDEKTAAIENHVTEVVTETIVEKEPALSEDEILEAVLGSDKFSEALEKAMEEYHNTHPQTVINTVQTTTTREHIAIPEFPVKEASEYTDEEYAEERSEARLNEIDRILEFLGY